MLPRRPRQRPRGPFLTSASTVSNPSEHGAWCRGLNNDGLTAHMHTGSYRVPVPVLTTSVMDDISLIHEVVGIGELAISDSRSSVPSFDELARIASDARVWDLQHCRVPRPPL